MEARKVGAEAAAQIEVRREARVLILPGVVVGAGRHPMLVLDMFLAVHQGLVHVHLINLKVVWTSMVQLRLPRCCICLWHYFL